MHNAPKTGENGSKMSLIFIYTQMLFPQKRRHPNITAQSFSSECKCTSRITLVCQSSASYHGTKQEVIFMSASIQLFLMLPKKISEREGSM